MTADYRPGGDAIDSESDAASALLDLIGRARVVRTVDEAGALVGEMAGLPGVSAVALVPKGAQLPPIPATGTAWPLGAGASASVLVVDADPDATPVLARRIDALATALDGALRRAPRRRAGDRAAEDAGQRARALAAVLDGAPALVLAVHPDCTWSAVTTATSLLIAGLAEPVAAELARSGPLALVHPADRAVAAELFQAVLRGREPAGPVPLRLAAPGGGWSGALVTVRNLVEDPDVHGVIWYVLDDGAGADAVDGPVAPGALAALPEELLANVAHLVRTPLTALTAFVELLADEPGLPELAGSYVAAVRRNGDRLRVLLDNLLLLARLESGSVRLRRAPVPMGELVRAVLAEHRGAAERAGVRLRAAIGRGPVLVGDERWLQRLLSTVIGRAVRVSPDGGEVVLNAAADRRGWTVEVRDDGPEALADEVALSAGLLLRPKAAGGSQDHGFELLVVRAGVIRHGGRVQAESLAGAGTTVQVWLPSKPPDVEGT